MSCESIRISIKRIVGLLVVAPFLIVISPLVALIVLFATLFETDSCDEFKGVIKDLGAEYINAVKNLLLGRVE